MMGKKKKKERKNNAVFNENHCVCAYSVHGVRVYTIDQRTHNFVH